MLSRNLPKLRGRFNTISLQANSTPSLIIQDVARIPATFYRARIELAWPEWVEVLELLPSGPLRERLSAGEGGFIQKELQRGILSDALARGEPIPGTNARERASCTPALAEIPSDVVSLFWIPDLNNREAKMKQDRNPKYLAWIRTLPAWFVERMCCK